MEAISHGLYEKFSRLQWLWHKRRQRGYAAGGPLADPTRGQGRILAMLKMQDGISTRDLSYLLGIRVSSLNELLAKLEKNGYLTREPFETDKRVMLVKLTEKGKDEQRKEPDIGDIFDCLSEEEQKIFGQYLDRVIAALEAGLGDRVDDEFEWMRAARERMGEEIFGRLAAYMHGGHPFRNGFDPRNGFGRDHRGGFNGFRCEPRSGEYPPYGDEDKDKNEEA
jgi:DNA-binding MarR family transcriptional regulator